MKKEKYIIASCVIAHNTIYKNGGKIYEGKQAAVSEFMASSYEHFAFNYPRFYKMDMMGKLGWLASEIALSSETAHKQLQPRDIAVVICNAHSSLDTDFKYYQTVQDIASPGLFVYTLPNIVIGEICIRNHWKGENAFFIFEDFDASFIEGYVKDIIGNDRARMCLCGWVDVMDEQYKAALFLVGSEDGGTHQLFTKENMGSIFNSIGNTHAG